MRRLSVPDSLWYSHAVFQVTMFMCHSLPGVGTITSRVAAEAWARSDTNLQITMFDTIILPDIIKAYKDANVEMPKLLCLQTDRG